MCVLVDYLSNFCFCFACVLSRMCDGDFSIMCGYLQMLVGEKKLKNIYSFWICNGAADNL